LPSSAEICLRGHGWRLKYGNRNCRLFRCRSGRFGRRRCTGCGARCLPTGASAALAGSADAGPVPFFSFRPGETFSKCAAVIGLQQLLFFNRRHVIDRHFHPVDGGQNRTTHFFQRLAKGFDFGQSLGK